MNDNGPAAHIHRADEANEYWFDVEGCHIRELLNSPAHPGLSIARARVPPGGVTRWHQLEGITERYLIESGRGRVEVGQGPAETVGPGDVVVIPPGCRQRIANGSSEALIFLAICTPRFRRDAYRAL